MNSSDQGDIYGPLFPINGGFYVNISIGTPPVPQLLLLDTGSRLLWIPCQLCNNCKTMWGGSPAFDMRRSSFVSSSCYDHYCHIYTCDTQKYCGTNSNTLMDGVFRLSDGEESIHQVTGQRFSYCFGSIIDPKNPYSRLVLDEGADLLGDNMPYKVDEEGHYLLSLEGMTFGDTELLPNPYWFNFVIDSGTTYTKSAFEVLKSAVDERMDKKFERYHATGEELCYRGEMGMRRKFTYINSPFQSRN